MTKQQALEEIRIEAGFLVVESRVAQLKNIPNEKIIEVMRDTLRKIEELARKGLKTD